MSTKKTISKHEIKHCPQCNGTFECMVGSIMLCQCTTVTLDEKEREYIKEKFDGCLCADCMEQLKAEYHYGNLRNKAK